MTSVDAAPRRVVLGGGVALALAAAVATFTSGWGSLVADGRYEHFVEPIQFLARHASAWDAERNLGEPAQYFSPVIASVQAALAWLGASPWVIQRLTHTALLAVAGGGTMVLLRRLHGDPWVAVVGGFLYAFNPYTTQFLVPFGLFTAYAIAPWLVLAAIGGADGRDRWRWAAAFALPVFAVGALNTPALILASMPVLVVAPVYVHQSGGATWTALGGWAWRAAVLTLGVSAAMVVVLGLARPELRANIETTEAALVPSRTSSASESWRGLGFWLSYLSLGGRPLREQASAYFTEPGVIAASFAAPAVAGLAFVRRHRRHTAAFAILAGLSVIAMVGVHPVDDPSPVGSAVRWLFERSTAASGFRSTYKAGAGLELAIAGLAAIGAVGAIRSAGEQPTWGPALLAMTTGSLLAAALLVGAFPFWTGQLYEEDQQLDQLPGYWDEAFAWFDSQSSEPGVLVVPSASRSRYRWGFVNDGLFEAHLKQPVMAAQTLPQSTSVLADLTETIDEYLRADNYRPGSLAPILDRMGIRWVVVQNDLTWEQTGLPRPTVFDPLRADPDFRLAAGFGAAGQNVVPPTGLAPAFDAERFLPPVEVYEIVGARVPGGRVSESTLLMTGGGEAWPAMAVDGLLSWPVVYAADLDDAELVAAAGESVGLVITDGGQRRAIQGVDQAAFHSPVLSADEDIGRPPRPLFPALADQTIAVYADVAGIDASSFGSLFRVWDTRYRLANAFDGVPETAWATDRNSGVPELRVELARPTDIRSLVVTTEADEPEAAVVTGLRVEVVSTSGDAMSVEAEAEAPGTSFEIPLQADRATSVSLELEVEGPRPGALVGIAEVVFLTPEGPLDAREFLRAPAPGANQAVRNQLGDLPVRYRFTRSPGGGPGAEQAYVRREFWSPSRTNLSVRAGVRVDDETPDRVIDALLGAEVGAYASRRESGTVEGSASGVLDDDVTTGWRIDSDDPGELTLRLGGERIDQIELRATVIGTGPLRNNRMSRFEVVVSAGGATTTIPVTVPAEPVCDSQGRLIDERTCLETIAVDIEPTAADTVIVRPLQIDEITGPLRSPPAIIDTIRARYQGADVVDETSTAPNQGCRTLFLLDGAPIEMRPSLELSVAALRDGMPFESCAPLAVDEGWHRLETAAELPFAVSSVSIDPGGPVDATSVSRAVPVERASQTTHRLSARVEAGDLVVTDVAAHRGWKVTASGVEGVETIADGFVAWRATGSGQVELTVVFGPQRTYRLAWLVASVSVAICIWLLLPRRRAQ